MRDAVAAYLMLNTSARVRNKNAKRGALPLRKRAFSRVSSGELSRLCEEFASTLGKETDGHAYETRR
jgi:hypothetical protein